MATLTTFLLGAAVGGVAKWLYDNSQENAQSVMDEAEAVGEQSAEKVQELTQTAREKSSDTVDSISDSIQSAAETVQEKVEDTADTVHEKADEVKEAVTPDVEDVPIANYDELTVEEVNAQLSGMTNEALGRVKRYEMTHQNRVTITREVDNQMADLSIPFYDKLTIAEIEPLLSPLSADQIQTIRDYEATHANRVTLLRQLDSELAKRESTGD